MSETQFDNQFAIVNPFDPVWREDPYPLYAHLRETGDAVLVNDRFWVVARHRAAGTVLRDFKRFSTARHVTRRPGMHVGSTLKAFSDMLLHTDPPKHGPVRSLMSAAFSPRRVGEMELRTQEIIDDLLKQPLRDGGMDFSKDFAYQLPLILISRMLGIPAADLPLCRGWGDSFALAQGRKPSAEAIANSDRAMDECLAYFGAMAAERRKIPRDDLVTALVEAEVDGERLTDRQIQVNTMLLVTAGHESTANLLANGLNAFFAFPDQWERLRADPGLADSAVDEMLRFDGPIQIVTRIANEAVEMGGRLIEQDKSVVVLLGAANRDPDLFEDPDRFDITRKNSGQHAAFGIGRHFCLGAVLARSEASRAIRTLAARVPGIRPAGDPVRLTTETIRGFSSFPVQF